MIIKYKRDGFIYLDVLIWKFERFVWRIDVDILMKGMIDGFNC